MEQPKRTIEEEFEEAFLTEDVDTQAELQNNPGEQLIGSESSPAQNPDEIPKQLNQSAVKVIPPEIIYLLKRMNQMEENINGIMSNCNDIERSIIPTLKKGIHIRENFEQEINRRGERSLIYYQADIISTFSSSFSTVDGYIKNIKFAMGRLQDIVDDMKDRLNEGKNE